MIDDWSFSGALDAIDNANAAIEAYEAGRAAVDEPRSLWQRLGLLGKDPGGTLDDARAAFEQGDFGMAAARAISAQDTLEGAGRAAFNRTLFALAALAVVAALVFGGRWALREPRPAF
jgi:hypothetical protein